jgi:hypothetical protein
MKRGREGGREGGTNGEARGVCSGNTKRRREDKRMVV